MEINQNWLADQVIGSEQYRELERQYDSALNYQEQLENRVADLLNQLAEQANKLRTYELVESRLWKELTEKQANNG